MSSSYTDELKTKVKDAVNLVDYAHSQGLRPLPGHKDRYACPWRPGADSDGFVIMPDRWYDHTRAKGGDAISFASLYHGCGFREALAKLAAHAGMQVPSKGQGEKRLVGTYDYRDADGKLVLQVLRYELPNGDKTFSQRRPDPDQPGKWINSTGGMKKPLYRLPEWQDADTVYVVEGEKDVDRLFGLNFKATTNTGGALKWFPEYNEFLNGKKVVILYDNDEPGERHGRMVAQALQPVTASVKLIRISNLKKGDVSVWLDHEGGTPEELQQIVDAAPLWLPDAAWPELDSRPVLPPLPPFPHDAMPDVLREMAVEISETFRVPVEASALSVLCIAGMACGRNLYTSVKKDVFARANLFGVVFLARGERKSSLYAPAMRPVEDWIAVHREEYRKQRRALARLEQKKVLLEKRCADPSASASAAQKALDEVEGQIVRLTGEMRNPNFLVEDVTPEGLVRQMEVTGGIAAVFTDDARKPMKILLGAYTGGESCEEVYLKGFDGTSPLMRLRASGESINVDRPCIGTLFLVQMDFLQKLGERSDLFESGFISRNIFCVPDSLVGKRSEDGTLLRAYSDREIEEEVKTKYSKLIASLLDEAWVTSQRKDVPISADAKAMWTEFHDATEAQHGNNGSTDRAIDFAIRLVPMSLRLALIASRCAGHAEITEEDMRKGIAICQYFSAHACRRIQLMNKEKMPAAASRLLRRITSHRHQEFTISQMQRELGVGSVEVVQTAVDLLCSSNYCRLKAMAATVDRPGRRPSPVYEVNPALWER